MTTPPSTRCYVLIAREAPVAAVFRRGPSGVVQLLKWNLADDTFEEGQWFKGRIYERRADLSPSGEHLIYFAAKHKAPMYSWSAISKPPYLTALALWEGMGAWGGGGLFDDETHVQLNHSILRMKLTDSFTLPDFVEISPCGDDSGSGEDSPIMDMRLERDGWKLIQSGEHCYKFDVYDNFDKLQECQEEFGFLEGAQIWSENKQRDLAWLKLLEDAMKKHVESEGHFVNEKYDMFMSLNPPDIHVKAHEGLILEMKTLGFHEKNGPPWVQEFRVLDMSDQVVIDLEKIDWADWDHNGDLLFSKDGCLFRAKRDRLDMPVLLVDLTGNKFKPITAPEEFKVW